MQSIFRLFALAPVLFLAACSTNGERPLIFVTSNTFGVSIGGEVADTGGEFVVGYKGQDFSVIPVTGMQPDGTEVLVGANANGGFNDSYSVIGQFGGEAKKTKNGANVNLGKFFATGTASQNIAWGFAKKMGWGKICKAKQESADAETMKILRQISDRLQAHAMEAAQQKVAATGGAGTQPSTQQPAKTATEKTQSSNRSGASLMFAQYDYKAFSADLSAIQQGFRLTLGVRDRNMAVIPVMGRDADGRLIRLETSNPGSGGDAYSVFGQFESNDEVKAESTAPNASATSGLNKFFSTGAAAMILSDGFKEKLCEEYVPASPAPKPADPAKQAAAGQP